MKTFGSWALVRLPCRIDRCWQIGLIILLSVIGSSKALAQLPSSDTIDYGAEQSYAVTTPAYIGGTQGVYLQMRVWLDANSSGSAEALQIRVNDVLVSGERLVNKPLTFRLRNGLEFEWCSSAAIKRWRQRFGQAVSPATYPADPDPWGTHPNDMVLTDTTLLKVNITDLLNAGAGSSNTIKLKNFQYNGGSVPVKFVDASVLVDTWSLPPQETYGTVPTGNQPQYEPTFDTGTFSVSVDTTGTTKGMIRVQVNGDEYRFTSGFTYPNTLSRHNVLGDKVSWGSSYVGEATSESNFRGFAVTTPTSNTYEISTGGGYYSLTRRITKHADRVDVEDTLTNLTNADLGIGIRNDVRFPELPTTVRTAGFLLPTKNASVFERTAENPTVYIGGANSAIGFVARDDVYRIQSTKNVYTPVTGNPNYTAAWTTYSQYGFASIHTYRFGLGANASHTIKWSIFPRTENHYWNFVNSVRGVLGVNFTIPGTFSFVKTTDPWINLTAAEKAAYVANRGNKFLSSNVAQWNVFDTNYHSAWAYGTAVPFAPNWLSQTQSLLDAFKAQDASLVRLLYFHCFASTENDSWTVYPNDRMLSSYAVQDQITYKSGARNSTVIREDDWPLFYPYRSGTTSNSYALALDNVLSKVNVDGATTGQWAFDGVYWDEFSAMKYSEFYSPNAWDAHTVKMDLTTFQVENRMNSIFLISQEFRVRKVSQIRSGGKWVVANTQPLTETESSLHIPRFVETNPISFLTKTQLYSPVGLGDNQAGNGEVDFARQMKAHLDRAALYYYYENGLVTMTYPKLTSHMFPFTPVKIEPGIMIGEERILMSKPGVVRFANGVSMANASVHIYDEDGVEIANPSAYIIRDSINGTASMGWMTVYLPTGYVAAILYP